MSRSCAGLRISARLRSVQQPGRRRTAGPALVVLAIVALIGSGTVGAVGSTTLGNGNVGGSLDAGAPGYLDVSGPFETKGGTTSYMRAYIRGEARAMSVRGVVYAHSGERPGVRVAATRPVTVPARAAAAWVTLPFARAVPLAAGRYWLGFWYGPGTGSGDGGGFAYTSASGSEWYAPATYGPKAKAPAVFAGSSARSGDSRYSIVAPLLSSGRPKGVGSTSTRSRTDRAGGFFEDTREGFPKIAAYRPGCVDGATAARFDWLVTAGYCVDTLDAGHALNPSLLGMIQPTIPGSGDFVAATYGAYDLIRSRIFDDVVGNVRSFQSSDWLHDVDGSVHVFGTVNVLNWLSSDTALWSADVVAYLARKNGALGSAHPGVSGVWGDNDLWSDQVYALAGTPLDPNAVGASVAAANRATWDTNFVAHHDRIARDLPGMVVGGNDLASYSDDPGSYKGSQPNGWDLPGISSAGMRECVDKYFGLYDASGVDRLVTAAQRYLSGKALDGKQRYLMLNNCNATSPRVNDYSLAVATIAGMYYWPYTSSDWRTTLTIAPSIPDVTRNGVRNWLGFPTAPPQKIASGLWKRTFQHGVVYANMTGSAQTVDGHALANETGLFVSS